MTTQSSAPRRARTPFAMRHPLQTLHYSPPAIRLAEWRARRDRLRGTRDAAARAGDAIRSRTPVLRDRQNPASGRPHRDDQRVGRAIDRSLARKAPQRRQDARAARQPEYARTIARAARAASPRAGRESR